MPRVDTATAAAIAEVKPGTIRVWVCRGILTRHSDGIDLAELMHWLDVQRNNEFAELAKKRRYTS